MASDVHIGLGWDWNDRDKVTECFGLKFLLGDDYDNDRDEFETSHPEIVDYPFCETDWRSDGNLIATVQHEIELVWGHVLIEMAKEYEWKYQGANNGIAGKTYHHYLTPLGLREFSPASIEIYLDRAQFDQRTEDTLLGICLTSRYYPTLLDWQHWRGGLVPLKPENLQWLERFQQLLTRKYPAFKSAYLIFPEVFY